MLQGVVATLAAATFAFVCIQLAPGDPATALGEGVPQAVRERVRDIFGYGDPLLIQYARWLSALLHGDLGWSTLQQRPALEVVAGALPNSLLLVVPGVALAVLLGAPLGVWQAIHARSRRDRIASTMLFGIYALPEFALGLLLLLVFSVQWPVLPSGGIVSDLHAYLTPSQQLVDRLRHLVLPCLVIAAVDMAAIARYQRQSMRDALEQQFVQVARGAGLPLRTVYWQAWRVSLLPVLTLLSILLPVNLLGVVFVEQTFSWPGLGLTLYQAITARDYAVVAACVVVQGLVIAVVTLAVDLLREAADPRLLAASLGGEAGAHR